MISKNVTKKNLFHFLLMFVKLFLLITFFGAFLTTFSTDSISAWNPAFFDIFSDFLSKKDYLGHMSTFCKLWSRTRKKRLKKSKNVFSKCVLDSILHPSKDLYSSISKKRQIRCTLMSSCRGDLALINVFLDLISRFDPDWELKSGYNLFGDSSESTEDFYPDLDPLPWYLCTSRNGTGTYKIVKYCTLEG